MFKSIAKLIGGSSERSVKKLQPYVDKVNRLEPDFEALSDDHLRRKTAAFRSRLEDGQDLDSLLPEAFAAVREASKRTLGQRHFDVQIIGGVVLHQGKITEMRTGEGKTLVATLPAYLNALTDNGVHVVTVNDYLARRDVSELDSNPNRDVIRDRPQIEKLSYKIQNARSVHFGRPIDFVAIPRSFCKGYQIHRD